MEGIKQMVLPGTMWIAIGLLIVILLFDIFSPKSLKEGFKTLVGSKPVEVIDERFPVVITVPSTFGKVKPN